MELNPEKADLNCLDDLLKRKENWRYWINLCGQDFPLKSQNAISRILSVSYPQNLVESVEMPAQKEGRYSQSFETIGEGNEGVGDSQLAPTGTARKLRILQSGDL